jgi:DNA repair exonuclease SbcCD ATPase subunit
MRALAWCLAAALALAGCKSDDKKEPEPAKRPPTPGEMKEKAAETAEQMKEKAETAADKAKAALDTATEKMKAAGEVAVDKTAEALTDAKGLREALAAIEARLKKAAEDVQNASTEDARKAAAAALEKLKQEKVRLEERLAALRKDGKDDQDKKAP